MTAMRRCAAPKRHGRTCRWTHRERCEDLDGADDPGQGIDDLHGRPGEIYEGLFTGLVLKTHDDTLAACSGPRELAEPGVAVPVGALLMTFKSAEPQRHALAGKFIEDAFPVGEYCYHSRLRRVAGTEERARCRASRRSCLREAWHVIPVSPEC